MVNSLYNSNDVKLDTILSVTVIVAEKAMITANDIITWNRQACCRTQAFNITDKFFVDECLDCYRL